MQRMRARSWVERRRLPCAHLRKAHDAQITQPHWQVGRRNLDVSAGKTSRLCDERALRPSGWLPSDEEVDASRRPKCTLADSTDVQCGARSACWKQLELNVAAAAECVGQMGHGGLGTVLGWLVGWCGGALGSKYILIHRIKYNMYLERLAYEPNVIEV